MLDERKYKAIQLLVESKHNKSEICEIVGISRPTLYVWLENEEFVAELNRVLQQIKTYGENNIKANVDRYIKNIDVLAHAASSEKTRLEANQYLIDRVLGKTTAKIEIDKDSEADTTNKEDLEAIFNVDNEGMGE